MKYFFRGLTVAAMAVLSVCFAGCNDDDGGLTTAEQFEYENSRIDDFIEANSLNAETDENSFLRYFVTAQGSGISAAFPLNPNVTVVDSVTISYEARLLDSQDIVLSATNQKIAYRDLLTGVKLGLQFVREGGSIVFFVPSAYAFGASGSGDVPPNSTLIYNLDLVEVHAERLFEDIAIIDQYLADSSITAQEHITGLRYKINEPGSGKSPNWRNVVIVNYEGRLLETGQVFDSADNVRLLLQELITGWTIGLPEIESGGSMTLYVPSGMGYGPSGAGSIPGNAVLIFDLDLIAVQ
ncbi:MAG: FKBP-type peptidyl-prolyl cis-trans isomerase [Cyclobacteriaceae bacterium]